MNNPNLFPTPGKRHPLPLTFYILLLISCACGVCAEGREGWIITASDRAFFREIQNAVLTDNIDWLANAVAYPIVLRPGGREITVKNKRALKKRAKLVFNEHLKSVVKAQSPDTLFKNWRGVMIGDGEIWFSEVTETSQKQQGWVCRIIAINLNTTPI